MELEERLRKQWVDSAQDWIEADKANRAGMLDTWMLDVLGDVSGKTVIDIGCGEGRFSRILAGLGATVIGVDLTEPLIERTRDLAVGGDTYLLGNAEDLDNVDAESFDLALSYIFLVDLLDYRAFVEQTYRVICLPSSTQDSYLRRCMSRLPQMSS